MFLGRNIQNPRAAMQAGLVLLVLANLATLFLHPFARFGNGMIDAVKGLLYGLSFGLLLLSLRLRKKASSSCA